MRDMEDLKVKHMQVDIPTELDMRVKQAIAKGGSHMKTKQRRRRYLGALSSIAAAMLVFVLALNGSPAFADYVSQLPGGGIIVRLLTFMGDRVLGGEITDGQDIWRITVQQRTDSETIHVDFAAEFDFTQVAPSGAPAGTAGHFTITQNTHPNSIVVHVSGVRGFTAAQHLPDLSRMQLLGEIYKIATFDDSAHRFVVTFKQPITIEVTEQRNPARVSIRVRKATHALLPLPPMYSLRTASHSFRAAASVAEETLMYLGSPRTRILRDAEGLYLAEEGLYITRAEAEARLAELKNAQVGIDLYIEQREEHQLPRSMQ
ncbi:MAG: hypothetical protein DDT38_01306 [Firmicutes bacterium]|nr:hypothetical protein [candidate division NPL-UPA2 bacterium]